MSTKVNEGDKFSSKSFGDFVVVKCTNSTEMYIKFDNTGGISKSTAGNIRKGIVKDNLAKLVYGVGCIGEGKYRSRLPNNGPCTKEYSTWSSMMFRCYGDNRDESTYRNYNDCIVTQEWHNFQNFAIWCQTQPQMNAPDSSLEKDILVKGNKLYSPATTCFVPAIINAAVTGLKYQNAAGRAGVWKFKDSFISEVTMFSTKAGLGSYDNLEDASYVYTKVKESYIRALAEVYRDRLREDTYLKLKVWKCEDIE